MQGSAEDVSIKDWYEPKIKYNFVAFQLVFDFKMPKNVSLGCTSCKEFALFSFNLNPKKLDDQTYGIYARCPICTYKYFLIGHQISGSDTVEYTFLPKPFTIPKIEIESIDLLPESIMSLYSDVQKLAETQVEGAILIPMRKTLEAMVCELKSLPKLPEGKFLATMLKNDASVRDWFLEPILDMTNSLKDAGNAAAHFTANSKELMFEIQAKALRLFNILLTYCYEGRELAQVLLKLTAAAKSRKP